MQLQNDIFYMIYPLGACGAPAEQDGICEHRIVKLLDWIPHWKELGITAIYFGPIFQSDRHGYDTQDYYQVDPRLGEEADFVRLFDALHEAGIQVVLDGVFHHVGRGFFAFQDVLQSREASLYRDWFHISFEGDTPYGDGLWYEPWEGHYELVKLNLQNPQVQEYLLGAVHSWQEKFHIDGLRLDVAYSLEDDFIRRLRRETDLTLIGEMLFGDYNLKVNEGMLHSCTNYENYKSLYSAINSHNLFELSYSLNRQFGYEPWALYRGLPLMTFADNHDVSRIASQLQDQRHLPLVYGLLFTMPGTPCLYYGSEWGLEGRKEDGDSQLRPAVDRPSFNDLTRQIQELIRLRRREKALRLGGYRNLKEGNQELAFERAWEGERIVVALNLEEQEKWMHLEASQGQNLLTGEMVDLNALCLPGLSFRVIRVL